MILRWINARDSTKWSLSMTSTIFPMSLFSHAAITNIGIDIITAMQSVSTALLWLPSSGISPPPLRFPVFPFSCRIGFLYFRQSSSVPLWIPSRTDWPRDLWFPAIFDPSDDVLCSFERHDPPTHRVTRTLFEFWIFISIDMLHLCGKCEIDNTPY